MDIKYNLILRMAWLKEHKRKLSAQDEKDLEENTIAGDFYPQARSLRRQMSLDYIVGLTHSMVAFADGKDIPLTGGGSAACTWPA